MKIDNKLTSFLLNPLIITLFITIAIIIFSPNIFPKYQVKLVNQEKQSDSKRIVFQDIDNDNKSEKFLILNNNSGNASYRLFNSDNAIVDQFNLPTKFSWHRNLWFQDANNNGIKEFYLVTRSNDSIFLNINEHFNENKVAKEKIYIDKIGSYDGKYQFFAQTVGNEFNFNYLKDEVFFSINVGYGKQPRNVYKYDYRTKKIIKSDYLTNTIGLKTVVDLDNSKKIIILNSKATSNDLDSLLYKRSDYSSWLIALDENLSFLFEPIEIKSKGFLYTIYQNNGETPYLIYLFKSLDKKIPSKIIKLNLKGDVIKEKVFLDDNHKFLNKIDGRLFTVYNNKTGNLSFFNEDLELVKIQKLRKNLGSILRHDFDNDGEREWFTVNAIDNKIKIYRENFSSVADLPISNIFIKNFGIKQLSIDEKQFFIHQKRKVSYYKYEKNSVYIYKYLIYILVYFLVLGFVFLIIKSHEYRENKKRNIERKILDLQLKNIKNQVDSHFVFNALNTISEMSLSSNKLELDSFIAGYSKFMRTTLEHTDKIATTIKDELDYVENFIKLQQLKFKGRFDYKIDIHQNVSTYIKVPKHCIFTYVENSLKYGLPKQGKGLISIGIKQERGQIIIEISDNGNGLQNPLDTDKKGTGKGIKIMTTIFELYQNRFKTEIEHSINNIIEENKTLGVFAKIKIKLNSSKNYK